MASATFSLFLPLSILISLLAISADARPGLHFHPCKTLLFISTSSYYPVNDVQNPNYSVRNPSLSSNGGRSLTFFFTEVREFRPKPSLPSYDPIFLDRADTDADAEKSPLSFEFYSSVGRRTKDIMSVVGALLFGVGCGALTAATMYLVWSLFAPNRFEFRDSDDEFDDDFVDCDDDVSPKKIGYVAIPTTAPPPAKEVV